nr:retrovirus-related Pol polyprotein from transposon TNT 1-94 [Tanacetum cinerariifolium]
DVFTIECQHPEKSESVHKTYLIEQDTQNVINESVDINYDSEQIDQNDEDADLVEERELLASLIEKLKCEIDESKNRNKFLETSNKKSQAELKRRDSIEYASEMELECAKVREMKNKLSAHQDTISILTQQKESQIKLYKTREDKELEKFIDLENKVKVLDNIVYKTGQSVQMINMLNNKCRTSFVKPEYLKKAKQANPCLRINAGLDLFLKCLNEEMVVGLRYFNSLELEVDSFTSQLETQRTQFVNEIDRIFKEYYYADHMHAILVVYTELDEVTNLQCDYLELLEKCEGLETELSKSKMMSKSFESDLKAQLQDKGIVISELKKLMEKQKGKSMDTKFEKSLVIRQPNAFKGQRPSVLGKPTTFSNSILKNTNVLAPGLYKIHTDHTQTRTSKLPPNSRKTNKRVTFSTGDFSKSTSVTQNNVANDFSKPVTTQTLPSNMKCSLKNTNVLAPGMYKIHTDHTQTRTSKLPPDSRKTNKRVTFSIGVIPSTSVSRPQLKSNPMEDRVLCNNSRGKKQEVEDHRRNVKLPKNKMFVTACNDSLNAKTLNIKSVSMCDKCVLIEKHDMCVLKSVAKPLKRTVASESNKKPRNFTRKIYEHVSKTCSWWYPKSTPSGYIWKPKSRTENVNPNVSMPLGNKSRTANILDTMTPRKSTCFICDLKGNDLLLGSRRIDLYSITLQDTNSPNPICLVAKATSSQAWLWHHRLSHLNFDTINLLSKNDIVVGLPKLKFFKDHLCSSCELGKAKR